MSENTKEIKFKIIEVKEVNIPERNLKFFAYKTVGKGGRKLDVRFVRNCPNVPTEPCTIVCDPDDCNVSTTRLYPILWVKKVLRIEATKTKSNVTDFFDVDAPDSENGEPF